MDLLPLGELGYFSLGGQCTKCRSPAGLFVFGWLAAIIMAWIVLNAYASAQYDAIDVVAAVPSGPLQPLQPRGLVSVFYLNRYYRVGDPLFPGRSNLPYLRPYVSFFSRF